MTASTLQDPPTAAIRISNFINGAFTPHATAAATTNGEGQPAYLPMANPSTGKHHIDRSRFLNAIADGIERRLDEFAQAESADQGKPVSLAKSVDIPRAIHNFRFFASAILHESTKATEMEQLPGGQGSALNYVRREPVGVAGLISPWNLPLYLLTWKIAPCLATGNTCVCKPSEFTSHTAYLLCEVMQQANLPAGVVNMVFGNGPNAGAALVAHKDVPLISFTGGTVTGERIARVAAPMFKKLSLELGGKNAALVFGDADLARAVSTTVFSSFRNQGEICLCTSRVFVHRSIYDEFVSQLVDQVKKLKVGDPKNPATDLGALVSKEHMEKVLGYIEIGKAEGGKVVTGGYRVPADELSAHLRDGYYVAPTVITGLAPTSRCMQEEIFGPVTCVYPFDTEDEVIAWANGTQYGLAATVWTESLNTAHRVSAKLHSGTVWVNTWMTRDLNMPFGGVKASGIGREGWPSSLEFFTEEKTVCIRIG
ncbi:aldehyde dehydrogenase family 8 member A1 [Catenaria anguillulae PL171]|uniref:Aldehyde dehydrogenase family 8 member A1 n=1 Tax=Catenaria anguillulae PL171 TaxID=765915 RepID=A0A1Y2I4M5_9FUNG|nr:aldehyde dehydrogenase family 8 member A1 [Catenaria anguillulae PL171]